MYPELLVAEYRVQENGYTIPMSVTRSSSCGFPCKISVNFEVLNYVLLEIMSL